MRLFLFIDYFVFLILQGRNHVVPPDYNRAIYPKVRANFEFAARNEQVCTYKNACPFLNMKALILDLLNTTHTNN